MAAQRRDGLFQFLVGLDPFAKAQPAFSRVRVSNVAKSKHDGEKSNLQ
jgi:hypothetical protein